MKPHTTTASVLLATSSLLGTLLLGACASTPVPSAQLLQARATVHSAEIDPAVLERAPLELKKATESLNRANSLLASDADSADINSAAYVANQQGRAALAVARAKDSDAAIAGAELERERVRADVRQRQAQRAEADARMAQAQTSSAQAQTQQARRQTAVAEQQTAVALASADAAQQQAAQLQQQLKDLQAQQTERGLLVTLGDVLFEFNRAEIKPGAQASLRKLADFLQQYPTRRVLIEGFTDNTGAADYNLALSMRRAQSVQATLAAMGVSQARISAIGYGLDFPVADNASDTNRALNRRVEVYIGKDDQPVRSRR
jgi:outer membrane protein OmpA-like peptidoglycan-associated protein